MKKIIKSLILSSMLLIGCGGNVSTGNTNSNNSSSAISSNSSSTNNNKDSTVDSNSTSSASQNKKEVLRYSSYSITSLDRKMVEEYNKIQNNVEVIIVENIQPEFQTITWEDFLYAQEVKNEFPDVLKIDFGYEGICSTSFRNMDTDKNIADFRAFKTDDEQGFYWCGEITLKAHRIKELYGISLEENSIFTLNMVQSFDNGDFGALYGNRLEEKYSPAENMELFLILNY